MPRMNKAVQRVAILWELSRLRAELAEVNASDPGPFLEQYIADLKTRIEELEQKLTIAADAA